MCVIRAKLAPSIDNMVAGPKNGTKLMGVFFWLLEGRGNQDSLSAGLTTKNERTGI